MADQLGSTRLVTDQSGSVVARHDFLPFGEEIPANTAGRPVPFGPEGDSINQKFTGQTRDPETGLDYFNARYFAAAPGRFNSPDPANAGADLTNPQSWNAYAYVNNNPLRFRDPTGTHLVDCMWDGCGGHPGGGGGGGIVIDGVEQTVYNTSGLGSNALAACPNNFCSGFAQRQDGSTQYVQYRSSAGLGVQGYQTLQQMDTANYEVNGQFATAQQYSAYKAAEAAAQVYAAFQLACAHAQSPCTSNMQVQDRLVGFTHNVQLPGDQLDTSSLSGTFPDPFTFVHQGNSSWYLGYFGPDTGHLVADPSGIEAHLDEFGPLNPLHWIFGYAPSLFINTRSSAVPVPYTCSPGDGCKP